MTNRNEIEALACDIYNAHRTERIMAGAKNVASWWGMDARHREHWMKVARRLSPPAARVPEGWKLVPVDGLCPDCRYAYNSDACRESHAAAPQPEAVKADADAAEAAYLESLADDPALDGWAPEPARRRASPAPEPAEPVKCDRCGARNADEAATMCDPIVDTCPDVELFAQP